MVGIRQRDPGVGEDGELRQLMVDYQRGSLDAFQEIYGCLAPQLLRYFRHLLGGNHGADDLLQDTFLQMHRSRRAYNPDYAVRPWAFGLARNVFLMNRRAARRFGAVHDTWSDPPEIAVPGEAERLDATDALRRGLSGLTAEQAEALLLHHEWGFTFDEIGGMLGITAAAARARASRGMADLRAALGDLRRSDA